LLYDAPPWQYGSIMCDVFDLVLNTAEILGSDAVRFLARMHGQCEIHAWIESCDREWAAGIIEDGLENRVMRPDMGWDAVTALLRDGRDTPVVMSYSVCDEFPSPYWVLRGEGAAIDDEVIERLWDRPEELWRRAIAVLRQKHRDQRIEPGRWPLLFSSDVTMMTFRDAVYADRAARRAAREEKKS
jgi:hypothetical protein